jgi:S1-C subfamily serine protease/mono/diheme cytochrome c family protein
MKVCTSRERSCVALAILLAATLAGVPCAAEPLAARTSGAQRLTFLLEYVGTDYGAAVRDGKVANELEYGEVLRFTRRVIAEYGALSRRAPDVLDGLKRLEQMMVERAPADAVWARTRELVPALAASVGGAARPARIPNLADGRRLWLADCAPCHGGGGAGDGPAASGMTPPPTAFRGDFLDRLAPQQVFDAVSLGVESTAMPTFAYAYSEDQAWDVAFFAMTLRVGFEPKRPPAGERFTLDELAASSNAEILARLQSGRPDAAAEQVDWFRVNLVTASGDVAPLAGPDGASAGALTSALQLQDAFASVAERLFPRVVGVTGYVRDPAWTSERLRPARGDGWIVANSDALRYPGFRPIRSGSGLLIDDDGHVVSGDHLVRDDAGAIVPLVEIELPDDSRIVTTVVGAEPTIDLVVLRVVGDPPPPPPALELGDSDRLQTGHWLIALGDPPGPERSFAVGLVAMPPQRQCYQAALSATRLQSSLTVPSGALGGPVVDILGHVVGLTVRQEEGKPDQSSTGVLPINLVLNLFEALKVARSDRSPWLGISVLELPALRRRLGATEPAAPIPMTGVYIDDVFAPSPASRAGIRVGDFLVGLGGHRVLSVGDFQTWLYVAGIGKTTEIELVRDGKPLTLAAPVEVRPASATTH